MIVCEISNFKLKISNLKSVFAPLIYTVLMSIIRDIAGIAKGMSITFGEMFAPTVVEDYPNKKLPNEGAVFQERFRGLHVLQRDENGLEKCVACFLCAAACPSNCIHIEAAENTAENRISGAERYAKVYNIDYNRCIFCGYCVEDAAVVVDVVDLGVTLGAADAVLGGVLRGFDVNAVRRAGSCAQEAGYALFEAVFVPLQHVQPAKALLKYRALVGQFLVWIVLYHGRRKHLPERNGHPFGNACNVTNDRHEDSINHVAIQANLGGEGRGPNQHQAYRYPKPFCRKGFQPATNPDRFFSAPSFATSAGALG